jgi:hypothetical protein
MVIRQPTTLSSALTLANFNQMSSADNAKPEASQQILS